MQQGSKAARWRNKWNAERVGEASERPAENDRLNATGSNDLLKLP